MITKLGKDNSYMLFGATGTMEQNERVHISKGTRIYAFGYGMNEQEYVVYDDDMHAVEICKGDPAAVDEYDLDRYFSPLHTLEPTTRPISRKFGIGFYYDESDEVIGDEVIAKSLERAENIEKLRKEVEQRKEREAEETRERLLKEYSYLQRADKYDHKTCGANIRTELARHWPSVKFSVRYSSFSGGDEYRISWTDGPTTKQVDEVVRKYGDMHPDSYSMGDYWDCVPSVFNELYGSVGYITTNRSKSDEAIARIMEEKGMTESEARDYHWQTDLTPPTTAKTASRAASGEFQIIDYSENAIAVVGDTRSVKDELKRMGGRFNGKLRCGAGWVFPKSKRASVEAFLA